MATTQLVPAAQTFEDSKVIRTVVKDTGEVEITLSLKPFDFNELFPEDIAASFTVDAQKRITFSHPLQPTEVYPYFPLQFWFKNWRKAKSLKKHREHPRLCDILFAIQHPERYGYFRIKDNFGISIDPEKLKALREEFRKSLRVRKPFEGCSAADKAARTKRIIAFKKGVMLHNAMWRRVLPFLDGEALRITRSVGGDVRLYNLLAGDRNLLELSRVSRVAAVLLSSIPEVPEWGKGTQLKDALAYLLAARQPTLGGYTLGAALSPGFVEWAKSVHFTPRYCPLSYETVIYNMYTVQGDLDPNNLRKLKTADEWYTLNTLAAISPRLVRSFLRNPQASLRAFKGYYGNQDPGEYTGVRHALRVVGEVNDSLPYTGLEGLPQISFSRILRESRNWHRTFRDQEREKLRKNQRAEDLLDFPEPSLFKEIVEGEFSLVWLRNPLELSEEGLMMQHCVSSYDYRCRQGSSIIYSLRNSNGRIATLEVDRDYRIVQLQGYRNGSVPAEVYKWVQGAISQLLKKVGKEVKKSPSFDVLVPHF